MKGNDILAISKQNNMAQAYSSVVVLVFYPSPMQSISKEEIQSLFYLL